MPRDPCLCIQLCSSLGWNSRTILSFPVTSRLGVIYGCMQTAASWSHLGFLSAYDAKTALYIAYTHSPFR